MVPEKGSLISSKADLPVKQKNKKNSRDEQSPAVSRVQKIDVNQCVNQEWETKSKQQQCQAPIPTECYYKNCQDESVNTRPKKPKKAIT